MLQTTLRAACAMFFAYIGVALISFSVSAFGGMVTAAAACAPLGLVMGLVLHGRNALLS